MRDISLYVSTFLLACYNTRTSLAIIAIGMGHRFALPVATASFT
jgi:hypothetical protein